MNRNETIATAFSREAWTSRDIARAISDRRLPALEKGRKAALIRQRTFRSLRGHHTPKAGFLYLRDQHAIAGGAVNDDAIASIMTRVHCIESRERFDATQ